MSEQHDGGDHENQRDSEQPGDRLQFIAEMGDSPENLIHCSNHLQIGQFAQAREVKDEVGNVPEPGGAQNGDEGIATEDREED